MIDKDKLKQVLTQYKADFPSWWKKEEYKWVAVKWFKDHWNIEAEDFGAMFNEATNETDNLLDSKTAYPRAMIKRFAIADNNATREMFRALFDESKTLTERVTAFLSAADEMRTRFDDGTWRNHYQNTNAISTYLWLRYPNDYFIYKFQLVKTVAAELGSDYKPKKGSVESMISGYDLYNEIRAEISTDESVCGLIRDAIKANPGCYEDKKFVTAAIDVAYYLGTRYTKKQNVWFPLDYSPLSVQDWTELLKDNTVFNENSLQIMARLKDYGGEATCKQLSDKYGEDPNFYNAGSSALAKRVWEKTQCPLWQDEEGNQKWWPILYLGKNADSDNEGIFVWRLRDELREALNQVELPPVVRSAGQTQSVDQYTEDAFLKEVYLSKEQYGDLKNLLLNKKNIILQGAPGVGKTFAARKLAYSIMGKTDNSKIEFVQFHQNCSYEDFVMGYRPKGMEFFLTEGVFYRFCKKAADDPDPKSKYFFIIDEINRGNLSKIFGELLMLIENDKRGKEWSVALAYGNDSEENAGQDASGSSFTPQRFFVPENVYIIGMMNTADRSLAMIDYALRRRFSFFDMEPAFDSERFREYQKKIGNAVFDELIRKVKALNAVIADDPALGHGFQIGHSYFCKITKADNPSDMTVEDQLKQVVKYDIVPLLQEYWFDEKSKWETWKDDMERCLREVEKTAALPSGLTSGSDVIPEDAKEQ